MKVLKQVSNASKIKKTEVTNFTQVLLSIQSPSQLGTSLLILNIIEKLFYLSTYIIMLSYNKPVTKSVFTTNQTSKPHRCMQAFMDKSGQTWWAAFLSSRGERLHWWENGFEWYGYGTHGWLLRRSRAYKESKKIMGQIWSRAGRHKYIQNIDFSLMLLFILAICV